MIQWLQGQKNRSEPRGPAMAAMGQVPDAVMILGSMEKPSKNNQKPEKKGFWMVLDGGFWSILDGLKG